MMLRRGLLLAMAGLLLMSQAQAQNRPQPVYTVSNVAVDATSESAAKARDIARAEGERRAFRTLLERLTLKDEWGRLPKIRDADLFDLVQDFEVVSERSSTVRYLATLTFRFRPDAVRRLLRDAGIPFTETRSKPLVVLPVLQSGDRALLFEDGNVWRAAWGKQSLAEGLVPIQAPLGDLGDVQAIDADKAVKGDKDALAAFGQRYSNQDVLVTQATIAGTGPTRALQLASARYGAGFADQTWVSSLAAQPNENDDALFARGVTAVVSDLTEAWKKATLTRGGAATSLVAAVPMTSLKDWIAVRDRLAAVPAIDRVDLLALSQDAARVEIHFSVDPDQLQLVMSQRDLQLTREGDGWKIVLKAAAGQ